MVPSMAAETAMPKAAGERTNCVLSACIEPEIAPMS